MECRHGAFPRSSGPAVGVAVAKTLTRDATRSAMDGTATPRTTTHANKTTRAPSTATRVVASGVAL